MLHVIISISAIQEITHSLVSHKFIHIQIIIAFYILYVYPNFMLQLRETNDATAVKLEQQIIIADCQVLAAIINFLHQDWGSYMKGGWVLRKAWKIYQKSYAQIRHLYIKRIGLGGNSIGMLRISSTINELNMVSWNSMESI